jgi:hypothetical protein
MPNHPATGLFQRFASRLRFPQLFFVTAGVFVVDLFIPDLIPFADEILLGLLTLLLGNLRRDSDETEPKTDRPPMKDVTPPGTDRS